MTKAEIVQLFAAFGSLLAGLGAFWRSCQAYKMSKKIHLHQTKDKPEG